MPSKEVRQLWRRLERAGFTVEQRKGGHMKVTAPDGAVTFAAASPSDYRSIRNLLAWCRRHGGGRDL